MAANPTALLEEFLALTRQQAAAPLSPEATQRLELLQDVLLELGALPRPGQPARALRAEAVLEVSFQTAQEAQRAFSRNIGAGGIAIATTRMLPVGASVVLHIRLPDAPELAVVEGKVAWASQETAGISFEKIRPQDEARLKQLVIRDEGVLRKVRSALSADVLDLAAKGRDLLKTDVRELAAKGRQVLTTDVRELGASKPLPAAANEVDTRRLVRVQLSDPQLSQVLGEVLNQAGFRTDGSGGSARPYVVVADSSTALEAISTGGKLVLVNVSGPDALAGRLTQLQPAAFVKRPATAAAIAQAVASLAR